MSTILWDPNSELDFRNFNTAIQTADEQIRTAKSAIESLYSINKGLTIQALHDAFDSELFPQWVTHFNNLQAFLSDAQKSYQLAMDQDANNAGRVPR